MTQLLVESREEVFERRQPRRFTGSWTELSPRPWIATVVQSQLQHLHKIEVTGEDVRFLPERTHLDTAAAPTGPRVLDRLPLPELLGHSRFHVEQRRKAVALPDHA